MTRKKLSQEVAEGLLYRIEAGEIDVGHQIPTESELAELFHVSRTAVREGIHTLIALGVLETKRGIGTFVRDNNIGPLRLLSTASKSNTQAWLGDLLEFRQIIEPEVAALAAQRRTEEDLQELERCVSKLRQLIGTQDLHDKPPEDLGFHLALARATRNSALIDASSMIARFHENDPFPPDIMDIEEHQAILDAIRSGEADVARKAMAEHIARTISLRK